MLNDRSLILETVYFLRVPVHKRTWRGAQFFNYLLNIVKTTPSVRRSGCHKSIRMYFYFAEDSSGKERHEQFKNSSLLTSPHTKNILCIISLLFLKKKKEWVSFKHCVSLLQTLSIILFSHLFILVFNT